MPEVTLSSKNQIVVPRAARDALGLKPGAKLHVVVRGRTVILLRKPRRAAAALAGIAQDLYPADYLTRERESW
jgi:AbrB family looped-hinge helix DNA binding protein